MATQSGDTGVVNNLVDDGRGAVSFDIDVNGDLGGSTHNGTVTCAGKVTVVEERLRDGGGHYDGSANGGIYTWHTQCGAFAGVHYTVRLAYAVTVDASWSIGQVAKELAKAKVLTAIVLGDDNNVVGVVHATEILGHVAEGGDLGVPVSEKMLRKP